MSTISKAALATLQRRLGYEFSDQALMIRALTHRSAVGEHNERLEFLGDAFIGFIVAQIFFDRFPDVDEGTLSRLRASVVSGRALAQVARQLDLSDFLLLGESERKSGGRHRDSILADALEALAGAVMMDATHTEAQTVVARWLAESLDAASPNAAADAKTRLQEWLQARGEPLPEYQVIEVLGQDHKQSFRVECVLPCRKLATEAVGTARRRAEQAAAELMLGKLTGVSGD
ncbi:MAG: ribonuclease III [Luminiphilus sp.]|nr:ribonuclease III [Luminiphilus sp.]